MKNLTPQKIFFALFLISLILIFNRFFSILYFPDSAIVLQKGEPVKIHPEEEILQKFSANRDGLAKLELLFRAPGIKEDDQLEMKLLDENCEKTLRQGILKKSFLSSENLWEFSFNSIFDSSGKNYCLFAKFQPKKETAKSLQIFTAPSETEYFLKNTTLEKEYTNQALSMRPAYKNSHLSQDLSELNRRISQYKPWFLKHYFLWFISLGFILLSLLLVYIIVIL